MLIVLKFESWVAYFLYPKDAIARAQLHEQYKSLKPIDPTYLLWL